jgi:hypothetical protein
MKITFFGFTPLIILLHAVLLIVHSACRPGVRENAGDIVPVDKWAHLSSVMGDIEKPGPSDQQTASLIADLDNDGLNDFVIASRKVGPAVLLYRRTEEGWKKSIIDTAALRIEAGGDVLDIDADGDIDIVFGADARDNKVWWWENPYPDFEKNQCWNRRLIKDDGQNKHHDEIFGDFDGDGRQELVFWNQGARNLCMAEIPEDPLKAGTWEYTAIYTWAEGEKQHEGLAKADIDSDGIEDIVGGGGWFKFREDREFQQVNIDTAKRFSRAAAAQLIEGGYVEVVFAPGDVNGLLRLYECRGDPMHSESWVAHQLVDTIVVHGHSLDIADINQDGHLDIFTAEMHTPGHGESAKMRILYGDGTGNFTESIVATGIGNHESRVADLDGDGDPDILDKPYTWETPRVDVWLNGGHSR